MAAYFVIVRNLFPGGFIVNLQKFTSNMQACLYQNVNEKRRTIAECTRFYKQQS